MALTDQQRLICAHLVKLNPEENYMILLATNESYALSEIESHKDKVKEDLLNEKNSHLFHINELNGRIEKINVLLDALEE